MATTLQERQEILVAIQELAKGKDEGVATPRETFVVAIRTKRDA